MHFESFFTQKLFDCRLNTEKIAFDIATFKADNIQTWT